MNRRDKDTVNFLTRDKNIVKKQLEACNLLIEISPRKDYWEKKANWYGGLLVGIINALNYLRRKKRR